MDIALQVLIIVISLFIFLYIFWSRLREDYLSDQIFTITFYAILSFVIGLIISLLYFPVFAFWISLIFLFIGFSFGIYRFKLRFIESFETLVISILPSYLLFSLYTLKKDQNLLDVSGVIIGLSLIILFLVFDKYYKKFSWYRSGRIGFSGLAVFGIFFLIRFIVAIFFPNMISFAGAYEVYLSGIVAIISFLSVYNLARR